MSSGFTSIEQVRYAQNFQCQGNNPYSQMYNVDWQNHYNLSNENSQNVLNLRPREKNEGWEKAIVKLVNHQLQYEERNYTYLKSLKNQVSKITKLITKKQ